MNPNYNSQFSGSELVKRFFSRTSMLTVTIASAVLSVLVIFQTVLYTVSGDKINMISSLYYLFDNKNISVINAVFGTVISLVSVLFFVSFLSIYLKAKSNESVTSGISALTASSVIYIIVSCITVTLAFASISVLRYESSQLSLLYDSREFSQALSTYSSAQASYDFFVYIFFGTAAILLGIGAVRLSLAMKKASLESEIPSNRGSALFLTGTIMAIVLTTISFFIALSSLVIPDTSSALKPINLLASTINVLILAASTVVLYGISFLSSHYSAAISRTYHTGPKANSYYAGYATNVYPTNANRPPVPPVAPYNQFNPTQQNPQYAQPQYTQQAVVPPVAPQSEPTIQVEPQAQEPIQVESVTETVTATSDNNE